MDVNGTFAEGFMKLLVSTLGPPRQPLPSCTFVFISPSCFLFDLRTENLREHQDDGITHDGGHLKFGHSERANGTMSSTDKHDSQ